MSFVLIMAVAAAVAASAGYLSSRRPERGSGPRLRGRREREREDDEGETPAASPSGAVTPLTFDAFPLALGDVVLSGHEERWLSGVLVLREGRREVAALFLAPEGLAHHAVVAFPAPRREIFWLRPVEVPCPDEPPATLEVSGLSFRRQGRLPVSVQREGQGTPALADTALFAVYESGARDVAVVMTSPGRVLGWVGIRLDDGTYERLGGGEPGG